MNKWIYIGGGLIVLALILWMIMSRETARGTEGGTPVSTTTTTTTTSSTTTTPFPETGTMSWTDTLEKGK